MLSGPAWAEDLLPVAAGHKSLAFPIDGNPPFAQGARIKFTQKITRDDTQFEVTLAYGYVLGTLGNVMFVELPDRQAATVALTEINDNYQIVSAPDPEEIAQRRLSLSKGQAFVLAPSMRQFTIALTIDPETVKTWEPGEMLTFYGAKEQKRLNKLSGTWTDATTYHDVTVMFRSVKQTAEGRYIVTLVANARDTEALLRAELQGRLSVDPQSGTSTQRTEKRCYITRLHAGERLRTQIPCTN